MVWSAVTGGSVTQTPAGSSLKERIRTAIGWIRYPRSVPEEVAAALGVTLAQPHCWDELLKHLGSPQWAPPRLQRLMSRAHAQAAFSSALQIEEFTHTALCSYHLGGGWLTFDLHFDLEQRLRRLYVRHPQLGPDPRELTLH
jgi:hypothetical protein